jgi:signal transduction histidine kinase
VVEDAAASLKRKYPERQIELQTVSVEVYADRTMMEMAVINLIDNALKYSERTVTIALDSQRLCIRDSGKGIPADELEKITQKFYRVEKNSWDNSMGLGLAIVRYILQLHHVHLQIESEVGRGTRVCFDLPPEI